jgi:hypothetical protein
MFSWVLNLVSRPKGRSDEMRILRRIFALKREELTGNWRKKHHNLYSSPNVIGIIKSEKKRWTGM